MKRLIAASLTITLCISSYAQVEKNNDEEISFSTDEKKILLDFPDDVYLVKGKVESVGSMTSDEGKILTITILSEKVFKEIVSTLKYKMVSNGWENTMEMNMEKEALLMYSKNNNSTTITVALADNKTQISYFVTVVK